MKKLLWVLFVLVLLSLAVLVPVVTGAVTIAGFEVEAGEAEIFVYWETASEIDNLGFYVWRSEDAAGDYQRLPIGRPESEQFIPSEDLGFGAFYEFVDEQVESGIRYYYKVQDFPASGSPEFVGPESAGIGLSEGTNTPTPTSTPTPLVPPFGQVVQCTLATTSTATTDSSWNNGGFNTNIQVSNYTDLSLISQVGLPPGSTATAVPDFFRLDNAVIGASYNIQAKPDNTINYNLGIVVYDKDQNEILRDADTSTYFASVTLVPDDFGSYYFQIYQVSAQCTGDTYSLIYNYTAPTPTPTWSPQPTQTPGVPSTPDPDLTYHVYLPITLRQLGPPPIEVGSRLDLTGTWREQPLELVVTDSLNRQVLHTHWDEIQAQGVFVIALVDVKNSGLRSDGVGQRLVLRDSAGRRFDLASLDAQQAAEEVFGRESLYYRIQPGFTVPMVFVFDVLPTSTDLELMIDSP